MFTGIIEELGRVRSVEKRGEGARISVEARVVTAGTQGMATRLPLTACASLRWKFSTGFVRRGWLAGDAPALYARHAGGWFSRQP
ncbi:MAG: hypothetical protein WKF84_02485 [Pyrinomonadaceae bacterium]